MNIFSTVFMIIFYKEFCIKQLYNFIVIPNFCYFFFQNTIVIVSSFTDMNKWYVYSQWNVYFVHFSIRWACVYREFIVHSVALLAHRLGIRKVEWTHSPILPRKPSPNYNWPPIHAFVICSAPPPPLHHGTLFSVFH